MSLTFSSKPRPCSDQNRITVSRDQPVRSDWILRIPLPQLRCFMGRWPERHCPACDRVTAQPLRVTVGFLPDPIGVEVNFVCRVCRAVTRLLTPNRDPQWSDDYLPHIATRWRLPDRWPELRCPRCARQHPHEIRIAFAPHLLKPDAVCIAVVQAFCRRCRRPTALVTPAGGAPADPGPDAGTESPVRSARGAPPLKRETQFARS